MDDDSTKEDVINENIYVIDESKKVLEDLNHFQAGCGIIENVEIMLNK